MRGEFGYWVFEGDWQPAQRPCWNYRKEDGGGIILDMLCHWRYVLDNLFGEVKAVSCLGATHIPSAWTRTASPTTADADDAAYATFELEGGVDRADQLVLGDARAPRRPRHVPGRRHARLGGRRAARLLHAASRVNTPRPVWNPDVPQTMNFFDQWEEVPDNVSLRQRLQDPVGGFPPPRRRRTRRGSYDLLEGAKGVQLAELGLKSWAERRWIDVPALKI